jgi:hypothetical protein
VRTAAKTAAAASERIAVWSIVKSQLANMVSPTLQKKPIAYDLAEGVMIITPSRSGSLIHKLNSPTKQLMEVNLAWNWRG